VDWIGKSQFPESHRSVQTVQPNSLGVPQLLLYYSRKPAF
jgi:hypothetical protein